LVLSCRDHVYPYFLDNSNRCERQGEIPEYRWIGFSREYGQYESSLEFSAGDPLFYDICPLAD
jgi:hypothetical protein